MSTLVENLSLAYAITRREIKVRYTGSILGSYWNIVHPLVMITIYSLVFSKLLGSRLGNDATPYAYSIYLCTGLLPWNFFIETMTRTVTCFQDNASFIKKTAFPLGFLFISSYLSALFNYIIYFSIFFIFLFFTHDTHPLFLGLHFITALIFGLLGSAMGGFCACFNVFIRDVQNFLSAIIQFWFWSTPIIYLSAYLPETIKPYIIFNPAFSFVEIFHETLFYLRLPDFKLVLASLLFLILFLGLAFHMYRKTVSAIKDEL